MTLGTIAYPTIVGLFLVDSILAAINLTGTSKGLTKSLMERMMSMAIRFTKGIVITVQAILASMVATLLLPLRYSKAQFPHLHKYKKDTTELSSIVPFQNSN